MAQIAVSLVLLAGAAVLTTSFAELVQRGLGFEPRHLSTFGISLPGARYPVDRQVAFAVTPGSARRRSISVSTNATCRSTG